MRGGLLSCLPEYGPPPMKNNKYRSQSRKATPWDSLDELSSSQEFIRRETKQHYDQRHKKLSEAGETDLINSFIPDECPFCHEKHSKEMDLIRTESKSITALIAEAVSCLPQGQYFRIIRSRSLNGLNTGETCFSI